MFTVPSYLTPSAPHDRRARTCGSLRLLAAALAAMVTLLVGGARADAQAPTAGHRFFGEVSIADELAPEGVTVVARIGNQECGRSSVGPGGRYSLEVAPAVHTVGCGTPGASIQFSVRPAFGSGWTLGRTFAFEPGGSSGVNLAVALTALKPDATNVPLHSQHWDNPGSVLIGVCGTISNTTLNAAIQAVAMWMDASNRGLHLGLNPHEDACRDDVASIVIGEVDRPDEPQMVGAQWAVEYDGKPCGRTQPCRVYTSFVVVNRSARPRSEQELAFVLAHEIGHALGLGHARRCNGGTVMWESTACRFPGRAIGVDDIAALNQHSTGSRAMTEAPSAQVEMVAETESEEAEQVVAMEEPQRATGPSPMLVEAVAAALRDSTQAGSLEQVLAARHLAPADFYAGVS